jgi:uncharacterized damage-inducible protein DinB
MSMNPITALLLITVTFFSVTKVFAQATISADTIKNALAKEWQRSKEYTQEYIRAMPAGKYSFKATDSVRTFAQQLLHLAQVNMFLVSTATGEQPSYAGPDLEKSATAQSADSVMYYVNSSYDFAINSIKKLLATSLMQTVTLNMGRSLTETRLVWLLKSFEHQAHHRGQTTIYLRLAGVHPPNEKLF